MDYDLPLSFGRLRPPSGFLRFATSAVRVRPSVASALLTLRQEVGRGDGQHVWRAWRKNVSRLCLVLFLHSKIYFA